LIWNPRKKLSSPIMLISNCLLIVSANLATKAWDEPPKIMFTPDFGMGHGNLKIAKIMWRLRHRWFGLWSELAKRYFGSHDISNIGSSVDSANKGGGVGWSVNVWTPLEWEAWSPVYLNYIDFFILRIAIVLFV
jgi:hypothetical protein